MFLLFFIVKSLRKSLQYNTQMYLLKIIIKQFGLNLFVGSISKCDFTATTVEAA